MFSKTWRLSEREHEVHVQRNVKVEMPDGVSLSVDIFRPASPGRFPALLGVHAYDAAMQSAPSMPQAIQGANAQAEAGDPNFYVRRGYVHIIANARGTGLSEGFYSHYGPTDVQDIADLIAWIAEQEWCSGKVGMFGASYFSVCAKQVAAMNPPALKAVWAPYGYTDFYRDKFYHGGILAAGFLTSWARHLAGVKVKGWSKANLGEDVYESRLARLKQDRDIMAIPELAAAIQNPEVGPNPLLVDVLMNAEDGPYWQERNPCLEDINVPMYIGASWDMYFLHLPGDFRAWEKITAPKKMIIGPPVYLDRPIYQYAYESLRWFDHWLKGNETGMMDEPAISLFITGDENRWLREHEWPLPQTVWHPFYLHAKGLLSEHEHWPHEGGSSYEDNIYNLRGGVNFSTPELVERTEVIGPIVATLYASSTAEELLLFASLYDIDPDGHKTLLTRGWLRGTMRQRNLENSQPWLNAYEFNAKQEIEPNRPVRYDLNLVPIGHVFKPGHRIGLRISSSDKEQPGSFFDLLGQGHLLRQAPSWVTIHHDEENPSSLSLPITSGNRIGTFLSGGRGAQKTKDMSGGTKQNGFSWENW